MYERALVPIDGSELSRQALTHVALLAPREVVLVAVMESVAAALAHQTGVVADVPPDVAARVEASEMSELRRRLREAHRELEDSGWSGGVTQVVRHGKPGHEIVHVAAEHSCDIIVMATHGRTGIRRALLGSVADYILGHVPDGGAVLLVRPQASG